MKYIARILTTALFVAFFGSASAAVAVKAGPRKGRILELVNQQAEFFIEKDRSISIAFFDVAMKSQAAVDQVVTVIAEVPGGKVKLEFEKKGEFLVSKMPLPEGGNYTIVVQVKTSAEAKSKNFRVPFNMVICKECGNPEYACTCDH